MTKEEIKHHILCGLKSGIPLCCVKAYVSTFALLPRDERIRQARTIYKDYEYFPCAECFKLNKKVYIRWCQDCDGSDKDKELCSKGRIPFYIQKG